MDNFFLVKDILAHFSGEVLRFFLISSQYRSPLDFSDERLQEAKRSWERFRNADQALDRLDSQATDSGADDELLRRVAQIAKEFDEAMADDFNTSLAMASMFALSKEINQLVTRGAGTKKEVEAIQNSWDEMKEILGLLEDLSDHGQEDDSLTNSLMEVLISLRTEAKEAKNWAMADQIRDQLKAIGVALEDTAEGVRWKRSEF